MAPPERFSGSGLQAFLVRFSGGFLVIPACKACKPRQKTPPFSGGAGFLVGGLLVPCRVFWWGFLVGFAGLAGFAGRFAGFAGGGLQGLQGVCAGLGGHG